MCKVDIKNGDTRIDPCMRPLIEWLNGIGYKTKLCCCGHGKYPMTIVIDMNKRSYQEILSGGCWDKPKAKFYKRDKQLVYFIPERLRK